MNKSLNQAPIRRLIIRVHTKSGCVDRTATIQDAQDVLRHHGLEVTTRDTVDWSPDYPGRSKLRGRICELQQRVSDLQHLLRSRSSGLSR